MGEESTQTLAQNEKQNGIIRLVDAFRSSESGVLNQKVQQASSGALQRLLGLGIRTSSLLSI